MLAQYEHGEADQKKRKHSEAEVRRQKQVHQQNGEYNAGDYGCTCMTNTYTFVQQ